MQLFALWLQQRMDSGEVVDVHTCFLVPSIAAEPTLLEFDMEAHVAMFLGRGL